MFSKLYRRVFGTPTNMEIRPLSSESIEEITFCFNQSFADYFVKFNATPEYLSNRWHAAGVNYDWSVGTYENGKLTGFIIHAADPERKEVFNAATGVVPGSRGRGYVNRMYQALIPDLKSKGIEKASLEVIVGNDPAIHAYHKSGFKEFRTLHCFNGKPETKSYYPVSILDQLDPDRYHGFMDFEPSWENRFEALKRRREPLMVLESNENLEIMGFAIVIPSQNYMPVFAVHPDFRGKGVGQSLFAEASKNMPEFKINNIDSRSGRTLEFLKRTGMTNPIDQYEMGVEI